MSASITTFIAGVLATGGILALALAARDRLRALRDRGFQRAGRGDQAPVRADGALLARAAERIGAAAGRVGLRAQPTHRFHLLPEIGIELRGEATLHQIIAFSGDLASACGLPFRDVRVEAAPGGFVLWLSLPPQDKVCAAPAGRSEPPAEMPAGSPPRSLVATPASDLDRPLPAVPARRLP